MNRRTEDATEFSGLHMKKEWRRKKSGGGTEPASFLIALHPFSNG